MWSVRLNAMGCIKGGCALSLLLFRLLELLGKIAHGDEKSVRPELERVW